MFKRKKILRAELPGSYNLRIVRRYDATRSETLTEVPSGLFEDVDEWCADMGLERPTPSCRSFPTLHLFSGDSVTFTMDVKFNCGKAAMLAKLRFGGTGHIGIHCEARI